MQKRGLGCIFERDGHWHTQIVLHGIQRTVRWRSKGVAAAQLAKLRTEKDAPGTIKAAADAKLQRQVTAPAMRERLATLASAFIADKQAGADGIRDVTAGGYRSILQQFIAFAGGADTKLSAFTPEKLTARKKKLKVRQKK